MQDFIPVYDNKQSPAKYIDSPVSPANDDRSFSLDVVLCYRFLPLSICFDRLSIRQSWLFPLFWCLIMTFFYSLLWSLLKRILSLASPLSALTPWAASILTLISGEVSSWVVLCHAASPRLRFGCGTEGAGSSTRV